LSGNEDYQELKEIVRCVQLYFRQRKQQRDIAEALGISASRVSRLLKRAEEEGLYKVEFNFPPLLDVAVRLEERYGLRDAVVIPSGETTELKRDLGAAAARYFERIAGDGVKVGLSCGNTLFYMVNSLREGVLKDVRIYPLVVESTIEYVDIAPNTLVGMMTAKYRPDAIGYALPAPALAAKGKRLSVRQAFDGRPDVQKVFDDAHDVNVALVGVGATDPTSPGFFARAARAGVTPERLEELGVAGEFNYQPIDEAGHLVRKGELIDLVDQITCVPLARLKEMSREHGRAVVGIGGGAGKLRAIRAVLEGRLCNALVTDQDVAAKLLGH
jgi:deoxyribonucleoside regulator